MCKIPSEVKALAEKLAIKSTMKHRMSAVIFNKKGIINGGFNRWLIVGGSFNKHSRYSIHAEIDCMSGVSREELYGASIYIYRSNGRLAKPCKICMHNLIRNGIFNIFWSGFDES